MRPPMTHRFIAACRRQPVDRLPVWMMRQAGRYQPSYRAVRQKVGFLELCRSPELIAQVTVAPIDEFGFDAAILFSDILVHLPAMGLDLSFEKGEKGKGDGGPKIANPVRTRADVDALRVPEPRKDLPYVLDGVRSIRTALQGRVPLIGFVGGPFTVASYVVEGGSQGFTRLKTMLYAEPKTAHALFEKLTRAAIVQIEEQIAAGAEAAQIFESWLGELDRFDLEEFSFPYLARIAEAVRKAGVPGHLLRHRDGRPPREDRGARLRRGLDRLAHAHRGRAGAAPGRRRAGEPRLDRAARPEGGRGRAGAPDRPGGGAGPGLHLQPRPRAAAPDARSRT